MRARWTYARGELAVAIPGSAETALLDDRLALDPSMVQHLCQARRRARLHTDGRPLAEASAPLVEAVRSPEEGIRRALVGPLGRLGA